MAHDLAEINGQTAMAYLGEVPWHRLGTAMTGKPDVMTAIKAANLDWQIELEPMKLEKNGKRVPNRFAVVRDIDGEILATVGTDYHVLQNHEAFGVLNEACEQHGVVIEAAGALGRGDRVWMLAKLPESVEPVAGDRVDGYFLVHTGHTGFTKYQAMPTATRVVCRNTLTAALAAGQAPIRLFHKRNSMEQMDMVAKTVTGMVKALKQTGETFAQLAAKKMTLADMDAYVTAVLGLEGAEVTAQAERRRAKILELTEHGTGVEFAPGTAWTAFNAVTEYVDHVRSSTLKPKSLKTADESALFGVMAKLKVRALELAMAA